MQKVKVNGQSVPNIEWKQTDGQTDSQMDGGDCITSFGNAIGKNLRTREQTDKGVYIICPTWQIKNSVLVQRKCCSWLWRCLTGLRAGVTVWLEPVSGTLNTDLDGRSSGTAERHRATSLDVVDGVQVLDEPRHSSRTRCGGGSGGGGLGG